MNSFRKSYDWREVLSYAGKDPCQQGRQSPPSAAIVTDATMDCTPFGMDDVEEVLRESEGENDERPWYCVLRLKDGRFASIEAGCDYTGWDCSAGGSASVARTYADIVRFGCTNDARSRMGITLELTS